MGIEVVTKDDLQVLRQQLLSDIRNLLGGLHQEPARPWLKNADVKKLLGISSNTIQRMRIAGKLLSTKIGGIHYYRLEDIESLMKNGSVQR